MGLFARLREVAERMTSSEGQEWIGVDGVGDTAALLRVIERTMPRGSLLNIVKPRSPEVEAFLAVHKTGRSQPAEGDYYVALSGTTASDLARIVESVAPAPAFGGVFVTEGDRNLLEAYRRDAGEDVVWLSPALPAETIVAVRAALEMTSPAAPAPAPRQYDESRMPAPRTA